MTISSSRKFKLGDMVRKTKGSSWSGRVVGFYSTTLTPIGYAVESRYETGSVQIYPENALAAIDPSFAEGDLAERLLRDADEIEACGGGHVADTMREAARRLKQEVA